MLVRGLNTTISLQFYISQKFDRLHDFQIKKNLFPRSRTQSHSSSGDKDDSVVAGSPQKVSSSLKTVPEGERTSQDVSVTDVKASVSEVKPSADAVSASTSAIVKGEDAATTPKALDPVKLAPMAKPESYADSLFQAEFAEAAGGSKPIINSKSQASSSGPKGAVRSPTEPVQADTTVGNNKSGSQPRRIETTWTSSPPQAPPAAAAADVTDSSKRRGVAKKWKRDDVDDDDSSSATEFSTLKTEAIIEPLPKSIVPGKFAQPSFCLFHRNVQLPSCVN